MDLDQCWRELQELAEHLGGERIEADPRWSSRAGRLGPREILLEACEWQVPGLRRWRSYRVEDEEGRCQWLECAAYPAVGRDLPILGIDLVRLGPRLAVYVADLHVVGLCGEQEARAFAGSHSDLQTLAPPAWFEALGVSGSICYQDPPRGPAEGSGARLQASFADLLATYRVLHDAPALPAGPEVSGEIARFDHLHLQNVKGSRVFSKVFGAAWGEAFVSEFLFPLAEAPLASSD